MKKINLVALIIATTLMVSGCETMSEIDKALYTVAEKATPQDTVTGERTLNLTGRAEQIKKGNAYAEKLIAEYLAKSPLLNEKVDAQAYARLQKIFNRIQQVSHFSDEEWNIVLTPSDDFNAFVTGGTYIIVYKGLMDALQSDDEIAAVLGHEMAHNAAGHLFEKSAHIKVLGLAGKKSVKQKGYTESFTTLNEQEADRIGILYMALAGYEPSQASDIWARMAMQTPDNWSYFHDHPPNSERADQTSRVAVKVRSYYTPDEINTNHAALLTCNKLWCKKDNGPKAGEGGGAISVFEGVMDTLTKNLEAKTERSRQQAEMYRQQYEQQTGRKLPSQYSYAPNDAAVIKFNRGYKGLTTYNGQPTQGKTETRFMKNYLGEVEGFYTELVDYKMTSGRLKLKRQISANAYEFQWENDGITGDVVMKFSDDGSSFSGPWRFHKNPNFGGFWSGQR